MAIDTQASDFGPDTVVLAYDTDYNGFTPRQVARCDDQSCSLVIDLEQVGISPPAKIDALGYLETGELLVSLDMTVTYPDINGLSRIAEPQDIVSCTVVACGPSDRQQAVIESPLNLSRIATRGGLPVLVGAEASPGPGLPGDTGLIIPSPTEAPVAGPDFLFAEPIGVLAIGSVNSGVISFERPTLTVSEAAGEIVLPVIRREGSEGRIAATVDLVDPASDSAQVGVDFELPAQAAIWGNSDSDRPGVSPLRIQVNDNQISDGPRQVVLRLVAAAGSQWFVAGSTDLLTLTITDDDFGNGNELLFADGFETP